MTIFGASLPVTKKIWYMSAYHQVRVVEWVEKVVKLWLNIVKSGSILSFTTCYPDFICTCTLIYLGLWVEDRRFIRRWRIIIWYESHLEDKPGKVPEPLGIQPAFLGRPTEYGQVLYKDISADFNGRTKVASKFDLDLFLNEIKFYTFDLRSRMFRKCSKNGSWPKFDIK